MPQERSERSLVSRVSFSLRPELQREFDRVSKNMGYDDRSKALQVAIQNFIGDFETKNDTNETATGAILILYDHGVRHIDSKITEIGHDHRLVIVSTLHQHLDEESCMNITVVRGKISKIMELEKDIRKLNGVRQLKYAYMVVAA
ncbi:MAG TPA: nickel-responsive transcriptional regulator NikR [Nitrososphaerales archaeon]|nr:nickel-responsive transcriptional regulator NikR [Nitrososphaerales archaeon]